MLNYSHPFAAGYVEHFREVHTMSDVEVPLPVPRIPTGSIILLHSVYNRPLHGNIGGDAERLFMAG